ncbi:MAG: hypothetical protein KatS3mg081_0856 [Gemmatimonadales bacterium]|nr:hypothetical protein HRbin33_00103 [bacterium HR33]GIW51501.1 MAG: hypothetical protein KatS3mg081_0856 [Gemmatimonadales bacterium]
MIPVQSEDCRECLRVTSGPRSAAPRAKNTGPRVTAIGPAIENHPALSVVISGPSYIDTPGAYRWDAIPYNGTDYTYQRWFSQDGQTWYEAGTGTSYQQYVDATEPDFWLKLQIWSLGRTAWTELGVNVNICEPPQISC